MWRPARRANGPLDALPPMILCRRSCFACLLAALIGLLALPAAAQRPAPDRRDPSLHHLRSTPLKPPDVESIPTPRPDDMRGEPLSLADFEQIAMSQNPALAAAAARVEAARGRWVQVGLYPNPVVGYHATEVGNLGTAGQQGGFIAQRFVTGRKLPLNREVAAREIREAQFHLGVERQRVLTDVQTRYYDTLIAQHRVELTRELARNGDELVDTTRRLLDARQLSENDLLQAEVEAETVYILRDNAVNQHAEAWQRLAAVAGVPRMPLMPLVGDPAADVPELSWEECFAMVVVGNPELGAARARVERAMAAVVRAERQWVPDVDLMVSIRHINPTDSDTASIQAGVPVPIFDANQGGIRQARAELGAARAEVSRIELDIQDRLAIAYRRYANARQQVERYTRQILPRARRSLDLVSTALAHGQADYLSLLISQRTYYQASLAYLDSARELRESLALLEGQLQSGSLRRP